MIKSTRIGFLIFLILIAGVALRGYSEEPKESLILSFVGDIMAHNVNYRMSDYSLIYRAVEHILSTDDLTFGNLEFPVDPTLPQATYPRFNNHPDYVRAAVDAGIEVFSLANNHSADQGDESIRTTLESMLKLDEETGKQIFYSGLRDELDQEFQPAVIDWRGWRIGFLSVTQFQNLTPRAPYVLQLDYRDKESIGPFLTWLELMTGEYDLFILSYHGGREYERMPDPRKRDFFHQLIDSGVHIVHGHHPHVLQPVERIWKDGMIRVILHSTGNFISGQGWRVDPEKPEEDWSYTGDSAILRLTVHPGERGPTITSIEPIIIVNYTTPSRDVIIAPLTQSMIKSLPEPWNHYYDERLSIVDSFLDEEEILTRRASGLLK